MRTILITGGTGLVGRELVKQLHKKNYRVIILTRILKNTQADDQTEYALWDIAAGTINTNALKKADGIIHLAGAGVMDKKWTDAYKKEILESRTKSAALLISSLKNIEHKVKVLVSASATGWYGPDKMPGHFFSEDEAPGTGFLSEVCVRWEAAVKPAEALGIRVCSMRTGIVLATEGGAYKEFRAPLKFGTAAILGSGNQMVSWIHIEDLCRAFIFALENENIRGSYNAVAPDPVSNKQLTLQIALAVKGTFFLPLHVPAFVLKIMMGARTVEILESKTVSSVKIRNGGFSFLYPHIGAAVIQLENPSKVGADKFSPAPENK